MKARKAALRRRRKMMARKNKIRKKIQRNRQREIQKEIRRNKKSKKNGLLVATVIILIILILSVAAAFAFIRLDPDFFRRLKDKTPPMVAMQDLTKFSYETVTEDDFIKDIVDDNKVSVHFETGPDMTKPGDQTVRIIFTDISDNKTVGEARLTIIKDEKAPEIWCEPLIKITKGAKVKYKSYLAVRDDYDNEPDIEVDNSRVNLEEAGTYPLRYIITDKSGNQSVLDVTVKVVESNGEDISDDEVDRVVNAVLEKIITPEMNTLEQIWAVYEYIRNIPYSYDPYIFNPKYEGYKILHENRGCCYGTYAASKLLLDKLGIKNIPIETNGSTGSHFWNMVSIDDGQTWYHYDACQWVEWYEKPVMCMICDATLDRISAEHSNTHERDRDKYPATPPEDIPVPESVPQRYGEGY